MKRSLWESCSLAFVFVGTMIGAGFATGQEIHTFFLKHPFHPAWLFLLSCGLILWGGIACCLYSKQKNIRTYEAYLCELFGMGAGQLCYLISVFFLLACFCVTASGAGVLFRESFGLPFWLGVGAILIISYAAMLYGMKGIVFVNCILTPLLLVCIFLLGGAAFFIRDTPVFAGSFLSMQAQPIFLAFLYGGYNTFSVLPLAISSAHTGIGKKQILWGFLLAFLCLSFSGLIILGCLKLPFAFPEQHELPFLHVVSQVWVHSRELYGIVMYFAMITTAVSCFYGFVSSVTGSFQLKRGTVMIAGCFSAMVTALFPFSALVGKLYGFFGFFGGGLMVSAIYRYLFLQQKRKYDKIHSKDVR